MRLQWSLQIGETAAFVIIAAIIIMMIAIIIMAIIVGVIKALRGTKWEVDENSGIGSTLVDTACLPNADSSCATWRQNG